MAVLSGYGSVSRGEFLVGLVGHGAVCFGTLRYVWVRYVGVS